VGSRQYSQREYLEQFRTTESLAWASGNNSYCLGVELRGFEVSEQSDCFWGLITENLIVLDCNR
jgi:hypothetical protein